VAALILHLAISTALRFKVGARVIQLPSGSMPTISEWACCEIWRINVCDRHRASSPWARSSHPHRPCPGTRLEHTTVGALLLQAFLAE